MKRFAHASRTYLLFAFVFMSLACASTPTQRVQTNPMPSAAQLSNWLSDESHSGGHPSRFFIQMADTQLGMSEYSLPLMLIGATWRDDQFETDARLFESAIRSANELAPAFVIICGDLVNRVGHTGQIAEFKRIAAMLDTNIPLYVVAGNHDVGGAPTPETLRAYRRAFGPDWYSFRKAGIHGIVLNSQLIDSPKNVPDEARTQLAWLRSELERAKASGAKHIVVFQHQSLFLESPEEADAYFNIASETRTIYLDLFRQAGVEAVLAGHYHRNADGRDGALDMITTGPVGKPLGKDPSGFRIIEVLDDSLRHEYFSFSTAK